MVFQFEHVELDQGRRSEVGRAGRCPAGAQGDPRPLAGGARRRRLEQPLLEQPRPAAGGVPLRRRRRAPGRLRQALGTVLHLHRGTPYVYQGEELGMTNAPLRDDRRVPRHRVAQPLPRGGRAPAPDPAEVLRALRADGRDNARTPMQWDGGRARRLHHRHAVARRSTRTTPRSTPRPQRRRPGLGLPPLPAADRAAAHRAGRRRRRLHDAARRRPARSTRSPGRWTTSSCWCSPTGARER